jgi:aminomethyltransferase
MTEPAGGASGVGATPTPEQLHETALIEIHRAAGARLIEFGGWRMPVHYSGILEEHRAVRERAGLFDLSHMGELFVEGPEAGQALARALVTDPPALAVGRAHYSMICAADGGILDDLIVYRLAPDGFLVVANAANAQLVSDELAGRIAGMKAVLDDRSLATALVAIQGPEAAAILGPLTDADLASLRYYGITRGSVAGLPARIARTGYTGEDGFEIFVETARAAELWHALAEAGRDADVIPCGLGARDTLRLEAGMPLYGNELGRDTNPYEVNLGRVVKLEKGDFVGRAALQAIQLAGPARKLVGLQMVDNAIPRAGYEVRREGEAVGHVTSGTLSPTLGTKIAMALVPVAHAAVGNEFEVVVRDRPFRAEQVKLPFYRRARD